jgi:O-acetyl-ADP-ribose deacetylase
LRRRLGARLTPAAVLISGPTAAAVTAQERVGRLTFAFRRGPSPDRARALPAARRNVYVSPARRQNSFPEQTKVTFLGGRVSIDVGDITEQAVDAVVNAANPTLLGGGGVDGAIHRAGGPRILEECAELRRTVWPEGLPAGEAVLTTGGCLPARHVIHTVGPIYGREGGREAELLAACYRNSLRLAAERGLESIAFPSISTGAYGYPKAEAASVASAAVEKFLLEGTAVREVRLVFFSRPDAELFARSQRFSG